MTTRTLWQWQRLLVALRLRSGCCLARTYRPVGWGNRGYCGACDGRLW